MMEGYNTIQADRPLVRTSQPLVIISCFACACVVGALALEKAWINTYSAVKTQPSSAVAIGRSAIPRRPVGTAAELSLASGTQPSAFHESSLSVPQTGSVNAVIGGFGFAALASVSAFLINTFGSKRVARKYQEAEANWSMAAATAFVGTKAPEFKATAVYDQEFVEIQLSQYKGKKYVVLFFYPLDFTFVCPTEITAFSDRAAEFEAINTQIIGVSVDSQFSHLAWVQTPRKEGGLGEIAYPLVADLKKEIAEAYGVLTEEGIALRGLFIIDKEGIIQHATINNLAFGRNVDETLRVLEAVQHVQANPDEVCPAGWKKGDRTMKPDPEGSKEYFQAI